MAVICKKLLAKETSPSNDNPKPTVLASFFTIDAFLKIELSNVEKKSFKDVNFLEID